MTAIVLIVATVGMIWGAVALLRLPLPAAGLIYVVVAACFGHDFLNFDVGPLPLTLDRLMFVALIGAFCVQHYLRRTDPKPLGRGEWVLLTLLAVLTVSTFTHNFRVSVPDGVSPVWRLIAGYLIPALVFWIARQAPVTERQINFLQASLVGLGIYLAVTGLLEITQQWALVFPKVIADPQAGIHFGRARGPMLTSVTFGLYLTVCLFCAWVYLPKLRRPAQLLLLCLLPAFLGSIYFSYTRSVWVGAAFGLLVTLGLTLRGATRNVVLTSLVTAGLLLLVTKLDSFLAFKREYSASDTRDSSAMRASFAYVSWKMFQERPLFGFGFGHFYEEKWAFLSDRSTQLQLESIRPLVHHNTFLSLLTETGIVGLSLFLALLWYWMRTAWQIWRSPQAPEFARRQAVLLLGSLGIYLFQLMFHELSYTPIDNSLIFYLAGVTVGLRPWIEGRDALRFRAESLSSTAQERWSSAPCLQPHWG